MKVAIIDIGSNAVRCVIYSDNKLNAYELYHERFKVDIKSLLDEIENLSESFFTIINRFFDISKALNVSLIRCVGTAALRIHPNVEIFCKKFYEKYSLNIDVISGQQEAFLSSCGLLLGSYKLSGIIADLGGGSLELAEVQSKKIDNLVSLPLGTKILSETFGVNIEYIINQIKEQYQVKQHANLYLIGGAFRLLAKGYIRYIKYPLYNIHNLEMQTQSLIEYLDNLNDNHKLIFGNNRKNDRFAIITLQSLIKVFEPQKVILSNYGLKEGVRFTTLPIEERYKDFVWESCVRFTNFNPKLVSLEEYGSILKEIIHLNEECDEMIEIFQLSIMFLNCRYQVDRNFHGHYLSHIILMLDIPFSHTQRAAISFILSNSFGQKPNNYVIKLSQSILSDKNQNIALIISQLIHICMIIDGPILSFKPSFTITKQQNKLLISVTKSLPFYLFKYVNQSIKRINKILNSMHTL